MLIKILFIQVSSILSFQFTRFTSFIVSHSSPKRNKKNIWAQIQSKIVRIQTIIARRKIYRITELEEKFDQYWKNLSSVV